SLPGRSYLPSMAAKELNGNPIPFCPTLRLGSQLFLFTGRCVVESSSVTTKSRGWLIASAILSLLVGLVALSSPFLFSVLIVRLLGAFAFASGLISLFLAIFGKDV